MIFRSLYAKLAFVLLGLLAVVGLLFVSISVYSTGMYQQEVSQKLNRTLAERIISRKIVMHNSLVDEQALRDIFSMLMTINPSIEVYLLDPQGEILAYSADPGKVKRTNVRLQPITEFLAGSDAFPILGDDPRSREGEKIFSAARIPREGRLEGYLYVILGGETYDTVIQKVRGSYIFRLSLWIMFVALLAAATAGLAMLAWLTRRLTRLAAAMQAYSEGTAFERLDLPAPNGGEPGDEIKRLEATFRLMARRIEEQVASLRQVDAQRRELIANISHDLRTPLTAMQGYLETLLIRENVISSEERRQYLEIAASHCKRLGNLVGGLFDLARLEAPDMSVHPEPFSIGELVQDVIQKFQLAAREKGVGITTNAGSEVPFVFADIALIGRVLENLLENAIHYTPPGGTVRVLLQTLLSEVLVTVSDTGCGIPREELPRIFERFYRGDRDRKDKGDHAGLGLAIVKKILELHGSTISVDSTINAGTSFAFRLPIHRRPA
jgi:two-component system, OmpR family, sensor kinase